MPSLYTLLIVAPTVFAVGAQTQESPAAGAKIGFRVEIQNANGVRTKLSPTKAKGKSATFAFDRTYQPGDQLIVSGPQRLAARLDAVQPECLLYLTSMANFEVPYGREEKQTGSAYAPEAFAGGAHQVTLRPLAKHELKGYRNLALNPCDAQRPDPVTVFPHASTSSVSRDLFDFAARNAIDGFYQNSHHGVWPFQSWGPQLRNDLWWKLDFGRLVELDKLRLMVRADFPHDSYWKSATLEFSDGSHENIQLTPTPDFQEFTFSKRKVSWFRLTNLVAADPTRWCSFIEVEAWGRDLPAKH